MPLQKHEWMIMILTSIASSAAAVLVFAFGYGQLVNRVESLEKQQAEMRADWKDARERIERAITEARK
jgi:cell division protein FtsL